MDAVVFIAVNVARREAILEDGTVCAITNLFDDEGDPTDDPEEAEAAVVELPDGKWAAIDLEEFEDYTVH